MFLLQPLLLTILLAVTAIQSSPLFSGADVETRDNHEARKYLANPHLLKVRAKQAVKNLKDFQIPIIYTHSFSGVSGDSLNRTISFLWTDVNSNTSTLCNTQWLNHASNSTASQMATGVSYPTSYVFCDNSNPGQENWQWYFSSMTNMSSFQLTLAHEYIDPDVGPFPYDSLQVFAKYNASLTCTSKSGYQSCYLPTAKSPGDGIIYGFSA